MIGAIIGDIVGSRFEFDNYRKTDFELFTLESDYTDDTVTTIATAHWLIMAGEKGITSGGRYADTLKDWCLKYPNESYGANFGRWIASPEVIPKPYNSFGNGAAMRISPVGDYFTPLDDALYYSDMATEVTHNHPEGMKGARAVVHAMNLAQHGATKAEIKSEIEKVYKYNLSESCADIRAVNEFDETCQVTVPQAIIAFLESRDFESSIRLAVSLGGDSDTIAAITGGISEVFYRDISHDLIREVMIRLPEEMKDILTSFYAILASKNEDVFGDIANNM